MRNGVALGPEGALRHSLDESARGRGAYPRCRVRNIGEVRAFESSIPVVPAKAATLRDVPPRSRKEFRRRWRTQSVYSRHSLGPRESTGGAGVGQGESGCG